MKEKYECFKHGLTINGKRNGASENVSCWHLNKKWFRTDNL